MRPFAWPLLALITSLLPCSGVVFAQDNDEAELALVYGDKSTVSIATGSQQPLRRAPAVAAVITAEDIALMGAIDLDQVLETVPGLHVNHNPSMNSTQYVVRGVYSNFTPQVLILQNGIPVTTLLAGGKGNLWGGLPLENVARIEVIRGPGSALYGADAFSGVINIITKSARDIDGTEAGARIGSFHTRDAWILRGDTANALKSAAYLRIGTTDGFKKTVSADAQTRNDMLFNTHASLAPGQTNLGVDAADAGLDLEYGRWRWRSGYKLRDNMGTYLGLGSALDRVGRGKSERITSDLSWSDAFGKDWNVMLNAAFMQYKQRYPAYPQIFPPGAQLPTGMFADGMIGAPESSERQARWSAAAVYGGFNGHSLRIGVGHEDLNLYQAREFKNFSYTATGIPVPTGAVIDSPLPYITPQRREVSYWYLQDEWNFTPDWTLTTGVRRDIYSDAGGTTNPRLALVWDASLDLTAKLLVGRAFRAPTFAEEYSTNNPIASGNPNLRPETSNSLEAAFSWQARRNLQLGMNFFRYTMQNIIRTVANPAPAPGTTYQNTGGQSGHGMEAEITWDAGRNFRLSGNYSYQVSTDDATGRDSGYAPHHKFYVRGDWRVAGGWLASAQVLRVADRRRAVGDLRAPVPDYTTVDLTMRTDRGKNRWDFAASVRNVFNADVREPSAAPGLTLPNDLPMAPRVIYVQAIYKM